MKYEFYNITFHKIYSSLEELQAELNHSQNIMNKDCIRENITMAKYRCKHSAKLDIWYRENYGCTELITQYVRYDKICMIIMPSQIVTFTV